MFHIYALIQRVLLTSSPSSSITFQGKPHRFIEDALIPWFVPEFSICIYIYLFHFVLISNTRRIMAGTFWKEMWLGHNLLQFGGFVCSFSDSGHGPQMLHGAGIFTKKCLCHNFMGDVGIHNIHIPPPPFCSHMVSKDDPVMVQFRSPVERPPLGWPPPGPPLLLGWNSGEIPT